MKKLARIFALVAMMVIGGQAMAQTHGYMALGASFPMGEFADGTMFENTALSGYLGDDGGAGIGFNAGLKWYFGVGVKGLNVMLSVDGFYNGPNSDVKDNYKQTKNNLESIFDNVSLSSPKYINVPAMLGMNYIYYINDQFGIFAEAGVGGNMRFITDYNWKGTSKVLGLKNSNTFDYETAFSLAWQAGIGIEVSKNLVIGCSIYDMGSAPVKGEENSIVEGVEVPTAGFELGVVHPMMLVGRVGFSF